MQAPKIHSVVTVDNTTLLVEFENKQRKKYDITGLLDMEMFAPLKNTALFKAVQVERGGYAVYWNSEIDISEYELWRNGQVVS